MDNIRAHVVALNEKKLRAWESGKARLEDVAKRGEGMTSEDHEFMARVNAEIGDIDKEVAVYVDAETREQEAAVVRSAHESLLGERTVTASTKSQMDELRAWARGEGAKEFHLDLGAARTQLDAVRSGADAKELRALLWDTGSAGSLVPTVTESSLYQYLEASIALLRMPTTKWATSGGNPILLPKVTAHAIATQVIAQGTAIGGTDPTFGRMQLDAFKYGELVQVSSETVADETINIIPFITSNVARAVGRLVDTAFTVGTGSGAPQGVMTSGGTGAAGTVATGGSLIDPTYEKLVDLKYSVNDEYRNGGNAAWLMNDLTAAALQKIRDNAIAAGTSGAVMWNPSLTNGISGGVPDTLLGYPVYTDPNVASLASNSLSIAFGDWSAFYLRLVDQFTFERSDDFAFNTDLVTFRGKWRVDSDLIDNLAINRLKRSV